MTSEVLLEAELRNTPTKGGIRNLRTGGRVPAILYGNKQENLTLSLDEKAVRKKLETGKFYSTIYKVTMPEGKESQILVRDVRFHPVTGDILHVDLMRVSASAEITVEVPVNFLNQETCPGLKMGGVLNVVRHTVEVSCLPDRIPELIEIDLAEAKIGDSLHISSIALPEGVTPVITDRDFTIATIAAARAALDSEEEEETDEAEEEKTEEEGEA